MAVGGWSVLDGLARARVSVAKACQCGRKHPFCARITGRARRKPRTDNSLDTLANLTQYLLSELGWVSSGWRLGPRLCWRIDWLVGSRLQPQYLPDRLAARLRRLCPAC